MGLIVLIGGGLMFGLNALQNRAEGPLPGQPTPTPPPTSAASFEALLKGARNISGPDSAPTTVVEFADFQCPSCRVAYNGPKGDGGPVQTLKKKPVRFVFRHFPLTDMHERAMPAAVAAEAAGRQGKFWPMYDALFEGDKPELSQEFFDKCARKVGLDMDKFHKDQADASLIDVVKADREVGVTAGVDSTPTFIVRDATGKYHRVVGGKNLTNLIAQLKL